MLATVAGVGLDSVTSSPPQRLTQARIGDTPQDGKGTGVAVVNAFATVNSDTGATVRAVDYQVVGAEGEQFRMYDRVAATLRGVEETIALHLDRPDLAAHDFTGKIRIDSDRATSRPCECTGRCILTSNAATPRCPMSGICK